MQDGDRSESRASRHAWARRLLPWLTATLAVPMAVGCAREKGESQLSYLQSGMEAEFPDHNAPVALDPSRQAEQKLLPPEDPAPSTPVATAPAASPPSEGAPAAASGEAATAADDEVIRIEGSGKSGVAMVPGAAAPTADLTAKREYDRGLALVHAHDFDHALAAFSTYLARWPDQPGAEGAMYWTGESYLAKGELLAAADAFDSTLVHFPHGVMAPDSLLKLGVCAQRLGREDKAKAYFSRLALEYPRSDATRRIPRDHSTPL
jgi:tol-pal system protein YbgF